MVFNLEKFKVGNAVRISCEKFCFEIDCIVVVATEEELNLAYFDKERGLHRVSSIDIRRP